MARTSPSSGRSSTTRRISAARSSGRTSSLPRSETTSGTSSRTWWRAPSRRSTTTRGSRAPAVSCRSPGHARRSRRSTIGRSSSSRASTSPSESGSPRISGRRARGSCGPRSRLAAAWSETCTTARSNGSSRSRSRCDWSSRGLERSRRRRRAARRCTGRALSRPGRAPRARPGNSSGRAHRPRAAAGARSARGPDADSGRLTRPTSVSRRPRGCRLLRRRRDAHERREVRAGHVRAAGASSEDGALVVTVSDDGVGGADPARGTDCAVSPIASPCSTGHSRSRARREGTTIRADIPLVETAIHS